MPLLCCVCVVLCLPSGLAIAGGMEFGVRRRGQASRGHFRPAAALRTVCQRRS